MTFTELDNALADTGRRSLASRLVFALADGLDKNLSGLNLDDFEKQSGYIRTNIRSVAASLKESGIIEIKYYDDSVPENETIVMGSVSRGRWSKQHYSLTDTVKALLKRQT